MDGFGSRELTILLVLACFVLIPQIISIFVYHRVLGALPVERRLISARSTYLLLIPFFSTVYEFYVVLRLSRSLQDYFALVEEPKMGGCGRILGVSFCLCNAGALIPGVGMILGVLGLLLWIVYMMTIDELRKVVLQSRDRYGSPSAAELAAVEPDRG